MHGSDPRIEFLRIGSTYASEGKTNLAKFWLRRSMPNAAGALLLAQLYARSRSMRSSRQALIHLSIAVRHAAELDLAGRREVEILVKDLMSRRFLPSLANVSRPRGRPRSPSDRA